MRVAIGQIYVEPGVSFPFSHRMQAWLGGELSALATPSAAFLARYGHDFSLVVRISARTKSYENEIKGPTVFKRSKDVEYTLFLPYDAIVGGPAECGLAMTFIISGIQAIFAHACVEANMLDARKAFMIDYICSQGQMLRGPWPNRQGTS